MNIKVNHKDTTESVAVWFGKQGKDGFFYQNGKINLELSKKRYNYFWNLRNANKEMK